MAFGPEHQAHLLSPDEALQAVIQNAPVSIAVIDLEGRLMFAAGKGLELIDLTSEGLVGTKAADVFPEQKRIPGLIRRVFKGETVTATLDLRHRIAEVWGSPIRDAKGKIAAALCVATDVTEREQSVRRLAETDRILSLAEQAAQFGIWYSEPSQEGKLVWSDGAYRIFGLSRKEFDGRVETFFKLVHPADLDYVREASMAALAGKLRYNVEHRVIRPDGQIRWVHQEAEVIFGADKKPLQMVGMTQDITERKHAEDSLRELEERYRTLIEASPMGVAIHQDAKFVYLNKAFADLLAAPSIEALIGREIYAVVHPDYREIVRQRVERDVVMGRNVPLIEEKFLRADGGTVDVEVLTAPIMLRGRYAAVTYVHDITRRKAREADLRASEERFLLVSRATNDVIYDWDVANRRLWWNERLTELLGRAPSGTEQDVIWWEAHLHPEDRERVLEAMRRALDGHENAWTAEYRFQAADGRRIDILDRGFISRGADGKAKRMVGSMVDLTSRKRMEDLTRESEEKFRTLFELADDAIFVADTETGAIVDCNRKAERLLQRTRDEILGMDQTQLHPPGLGDRYKGYFRDYIATGRVVPEQMYAYRKDGSQVPVKISASMMVLGGRKCVAGVFHDVTEEVRASEELMRRNQELERFLKITAGRELKMVELKKENEELRRRLGAQS